MSNIVEFPMTVDEFEMVADALQYYADHVDGNVKELSDRAIDTFNALPIEFDDKEVSDAQ